MFNRVALALVFTLSFLAYTGSEVTASLQLVPLILFAAIVFLKVLCSDAVLRAMGSLLELDGLLFVFLLSVFIIGPSLVSDYAKSFPVALVLFIYLILARLYMAVVPIREIVEAFFWSGVLSMAIFIPMSFTALMRSVQTLERFMPFSFHPNLLAFDLAGYACVTVWKIVTGRSQEKILAAVVGAACLVVIFFASSRGAIVGLIAGCSVAGGLMIMRTPKDRQKRLLRWGSIVGVLLLGLVLFIQNSELFNNTFSFVDQVLQLTDSYRGVVGGFSGRFERWNQVISMFGDGTFLIGKGLRFTDTSDSTAIDNSYIVILYETGLVSLALITWRFLSILRRFVKAYFNAANPGSRALYLALSLLLVVLLTNNIVARYLFGIGNPYSLFAFLLFATPTSKMEQWGTEPAKDSLRLMNQLYPKLQRTC